MKMGSGNFIIMYARLELLSEYVKHVYEKKDEELRAD